MRKFIILLTVLLLPLWAISYVIAGKNEADFDPKLQEILHEQLQTKNLSKKAILSVQQLNLANYQLTSVEGIEQFTNLKQLDLSGNLLTDSSFLDYLPHLENVNLSFNQFERVSFKSEQLKTIDLRGNLIESLDFVEPLQQLTLLNVRDNHISDLTPLTNHNKLTHLNVRGNKISSLEPVASLHNLNDLNIRDNKIKSIKPLIELPIQERLTLAGNDIEDLHLLDNKRVMINDIDFETRLPKPKLSQLSGFYNKPFKLTIESEENYEIFYTLDGSTPNAQSKKYKGPIEISEDVMLEGPVIANHKTSAEHNPFSFKHEDVKRAVTIKAVTAHKKLMPESRQFSEPITATYIFDDHLAKTNLPIISLTVDPYDLFSEHHGIYVPGKWYEADSQWSGNYAMRGKDFERKATFELFDEDKQLDVHQDVGIRINGRASRRFPQKSLRIYARDDYGQSAIYTDIFKSLNYDKFNLLLLRNSGQDYNSTLLRDGLMQELVKHLDVDLQAYQPSIVLLNGEYWGIHNIRERLNDDYVINKYNIDKADVILMQVFAEGDGINFEVDAGPENAKISYLDMLDYVEQNDMANDEHLAHIEKIMDIDNYLHYVAYQIYYTNTDSFSNNMRVWRKNSDYVENAPKGHDGRWRWILFDLDWGMGFWIHNSLNYTDDFVNFNMIEHVLKDERRMSLFRNLMENDKTRDKFIYIMTSLLQNEFSTSNVQTKIAELAAQVEREIPHSIKRWNNIESVETWEKNIQTLIDFAEKRPNIVKQHLMEQFGLTEEDIENVVEQMEK